MCAKILSMRTRACGFFFLFLLLLVPLIPVLAQNEESQARAVLSQPNIDQFPTIQVYLDVRDSNGKFIHNLRDEDVYLIEDEQVISEFSTEEIRAGLQAVIVLNPGLEFARRNSQAISRYDLLLVALKNWINSRAGTTIDDISLLITDGPSLQHTSDMLEVSQFLEGVDNEAREATPNLDTAFQAVELAADPTERPGMGRAVWLITPPLDQSFSQSLENLSARAIEQGVRIFVWMVGPNDASTEQSRERLSTLSQSTGGAFFSFSGEETLPFPEDFFDPLREIYSITYQSQARTSGVHTLLVEINHEQETISSPPRNFEVNIQPPAPAFIKPPINIAREILEQAEAEADEPVLYSPEIQPLEIVVDFPDGMVRSLTGSSLFVDGNLTIENKEPPFEKFSWDLSPYTTDGSHTLRVEVTDQFGLSGSSIDNLVYMTVEQPVSNWMRLLTSNIPTVTILVIVLAGALTILVLILAGRIRPRQIGRDKSRKKKADPVTQPVPEPAQPRRQKPSWTERLRWPQKHTTRVIAYLTPMEEIDVSPSDLQSPSQPQPTRKKQTTPSFAVQIEDLTIGSDPARAILLLTDPSVEGLHARIIHKEDGSFLLRDEGSVAGTWINYTPVASEGSELQHGDIIHIGRSGFRFTLRNP